MISHNDLDGTEFRKLIRAGTIVLAGNRKLRIYGLLSCRSGKRMNKTNRVFFHSIEEAIQSGYRPCGNCLRHAYNTWRNRANGD
ncbi:MAG: Ada metal-binding domain-containing protein [Chryseolinea sp.]